MGPEKRKLLLVEDEALVALDLKRRLEGMGFAVAGQAASGEEAVQKAMELRPDLVLMDIRLGGMVDGIEATEIIRRRLEVPVVYLTATPDEAPLRRARVTEPHGFVLKPIRDRELRIAVEMAMYRFRAEAVMRRSREWFAATLDAASDAVAAGDRAGAARCMDEAASRLTGWKEEEARGQPLDEVARFLDEAIRSARSVRPPPFPGEGVPPALEDRCEAARGASPGMERGFLPIREVPEPRHLERQLAQKQKLEAIGRAAAGMAHDFNNLLTAILGYSNLALLKLADRDEAREDVARIKEAGERAAELTRQLLAFGRRQMLSPTVVDLGVMARGMEARLRGLFGEDAEIRVEGDRPLRAVKADLGQMEQVLMNLAENARDAMPDGGSLAVETRNADVGPGDAPEPGMEPGPYVVLSVADTGTGMDEETRARLFEPFFSTKRPVKGTGLGLAMVYGIVKQSGGYLSVLSDVGRGSIFRIYLPATEEAAPAVARPPGPQAL